MQKKRLRLSNAAANEAAAFRLLETYTVLAVQRKHLLGRLLDGRSPQQWAHYPEMDAIDRSSGYQWFYHSHSAEDRSVSIEHGHIHLFARKPLWGRRRHSKSEKAFAELCGSHSEKPETRHLLAIGFDGKGLPVSLFTVNSWVTGDLMLGADLTVELLRSMKLDTGQAEIDTIIESVIQLFVPELKKLMQQRDDVLREHPGPNKLADQSLELLSIVEIDLDMKLAKIGTI
ncbi:DUF6969 family protein [Noviherbaspirillum soli]|uniref:DUF6969 family protein n=1 Tax=Noviherbaspirillum soli TaxID=1064518 RepID=UPI00188BDFB5|nr:hypothetical protein [Noviherbaspirillum soli]